MSTSCFQCGGDCGHGHLPELLEENARLREALEECADELYAQGGIASLSDDSGTRRVWERAMLALAPAR